MEKEYPDAYRETLVVLDATTGQNALVQAREFSEVAKISGIVLTKMDGTAKGGIAVAIQSELSVPVKYIGVGETIDDLQKFDSDEFVNALFDKNGIKNIFERISYIVYNNLIYQFIYICTEFLDNIMKNMLFRTTENNAFLK